MGEQPRVFADGVHIARAMGHLDPAPLIEGEGFEAGFNAALAGDEPEKPDNSAEVKPYILGFMFGREAASSDEVN